MKVIGLDHVSVTTADLVRSLGFYRDLIGLRVLHEGEATSAAVRRITGFPDARLRYADVDLGGGHVLELFEYVAPPGTPLVQGTNDPGAVHIGLRVDDIDGLHARLVDAGVVVRSVPVPVGSDPGWEGVRCLYALDPDGVTVELVEHP